MQAAGRGARLEVALALVDADHLALVDVLPWLHKQPPALLHALDRVRGDLRAARHPRAVEPLLQRHRVHG